MQKYDLQIKDEEKTKIYIQSYPRHSAWCLPPGAHKDCNKLDEDQENTKLWRKDSLK